MHTFKSFTQILSTVNEGNFTNIALDVFRRQSVQNKLYAEFINHLGVDPFRVESLSEIPFLPISFFKTHVIRTGDWQPQVTYTSSGTTGMVTSRHDVQDEKFYLAHATNIFTRFFGPVSHYHFLALLPSYLEREGSSLIAMANHFIQQSGSPHSGFYLNNYDDLAAKISLLRHSGKKVFLLGVSFALLDLAEKYAPDLSTCIVMETGGMKGRRAELTREEMHTFLKQKFNVTEIHSEYGMTELLSQAYSFGNGVFECPDTLKIQIRDINDPLSRKENGKTGGINVIDLANFHSCAFIETQDLGRVHQNGSFEILGRIDNSDARGCNLLVE